MTEPIPGMPSVLQPAEITPMSLLQKAVESGTDLDQLEKLMQLEREWKADRAREAFVAAMAAFKSKSLTVSKDKRVSYTSRKTGETTDYRHATLAHVVDAVVAGLSEHGLSHRWETKQDGNLITVTCIVQHVLGHSERTPLSAAPDDSGGKNSIQAIGSTVSYLQRYTLMAATGLAAKDQDDDGLAAEPPALITADQVKELTDKIEAVKANKHAFMRWLKLENLESLPAAQYERAMKQLDVIGKNKQ